MPFPGLPWAYGFGAAGVGMLFGLTVNVLGRRYLAPEVRAERRAAADGAGRAEADDAGVWKRVAALVALCALNIVFWAAYEQQGNTMQLWADQQTRWPTVFGFTIPSPWFQAFNPAMVFLLTPVLQLLWAHQSLRRREPSSVSKMAFGCLVLGLSFVVMAVGAHMVGGGKGSLLWPLACTLMLTVGELYLSPIGLSLVTKVAPRRMISMMMGVWFLASFFGNYLSGFIGMQYERMSKENFFLLLAGLGIGAGLAMAAFKRPLERAIGNGAGASPA